MRKVQNGCNLRKRKKERWAELGRGADKQKGKGKTNYSQSRNFKLDLKSDKKPLKAGIKTWFKSEYGNNEFMIWATVSSRSCFCWLYRASPSLAAKNIINLNSVLTIWWCPCVESSLVLLEEGVCYDQCVLLTISLCPASVYSKAKFAWNTPGVSWLPTFAFQSPIKKRTSFVGVSSRRSCRSS